MTTAARRIQTVQGVWRCVITAFVHWGMLNGAQAATYCAHTSADLTDYLAAASTGGASNGQDNIIHLTSGTFATSAAPFNFTTTSGFALTIDGGYDGTCAIQDPAPELSVLDGGGTNRCSRSRPTARSFCVT